MVDSEHVKAMPVLEPAGDGEHVGGAHVAVPESVLVRQDQRTMPGGLRLQRERGTGVSSGEEGNESTLGGSDGGDARTCRASAPCPCFDVGVEVVRPDSGLALARALPADVDCAEFARAD